MDATEYQQFAISTHAPADDMVEVTLGVDYVVGEGGELKNHLNKHRWQFHPFTQADREKMLLELGDVMWGMAVAAHGLGYTLEQVWNANADKLARRYPHGEFRREDSIARVDTLEEHAV